MSKIQILFLFSKYCKLYTKMATTSVRLKTSVTYKFSSNIKRFNEGTKFIKRYFCKNLHRNPHNLLMLFCTCVSVQLRLYCSPFGRNEAFAVRLMCYSRQGDVRSYLHTTNFFVKVCLSVLIVIK
jgi:hypothetical protein